MDAIQWLSKLISFDTVSSNSNLPLIEEIARWFKLHKVPYHLIKDPSELKANLFATISGNDGKTQGGILLSGHTDVVPVAGQIWDTDPFVATILNGKIYGRGACDMKGFIAVLLAMLPKFIALKCNFPIHFSFTFDEEVGCIGAEYLVPFLQEKNIYPTACIVGEPSCMRPIIGEKGRALFHIQLQGKSVHSSLAPHGCNAIEYASRLICFINELAQNIQKNGPFDDDYDIPYTTITTNIVSGGNATNIIPSVCEFMVEIRYIESFSLIDFHKEIENFSKKILLPEMKKTYENANIFIDEVSNVPGFDLSEDAQITKIVRAVTGIHERIKVSYATEAGIFKDTAIPTIICGPGDIQQAHTPNEFITIQQLHHCEDILENIIIRFNTNSDNY